jgi:hypothetical protein
VLGASETDQATSSDDPGAGIGPRQQGENPQSSIHRGLYPYNRRRISPAGSMFLIPVSGVPRLTTGDIQTNQSLPQSFLFFYSSLNPSDPQPTQTLSLTTLTNQTTDPYNRVKSRVHGSRRIKAEQYLSNALPIKSSSRILIDGKRKTALRINRPPSSLLHRPRILL